MMIENIFVFFYLFFFGIFIFIITHGFNCEFKGIEKLNPMSICGYIGGIICIVGGVLVESYF